MEILRKTYSLYGFTPLDTPVIESSEVLLAKAGGETEKQIYRFQKGDSDLSLRFDLTVPLAKYVALHYNELSFPFRRYQIGKVYRGERAQRGRFREFYQADIDIIGDGKLDITNEAEIPSIIYQDLLHSGTEAVPDPGEQPEDPQRLLRHAGPDGEVRRRDAHRGQAGQDRSRKGKDHSGRGLRRQRERRRRDLEVHRHQGQQCRGPRRRWRATRAGTRCSIRGSSELNTVVKYLAAFGVPAENFAVDLTIARGLDYYTGTVYETTLLDHPEIGSVCSGGRYDNLAEYYTDKQLPGVGISIGLTRLFYVLGEQGMLNPELPTAPADVLILPMTEDLSPAIALATQLRQAGIRTQLHCEQKKFKAKMSYADKLAIPYVDLPGRGRDQRRRGGLQGHEVRRADQTEYAGDHRPDQGRSCRTGKRKRDRGITTGRSLL